MFYYFIKKNRIVPIFTKKVNFKRGVSNEKEPYVVDGENQIVYLGNNLSVSSNHFELQNINEKWNLTDKSTNGTFINNIRTIKNEPIGLFLLFSEFFTFFK